MHVMLEGWDGVLLHRLEAWKKGLPGGRLIEVKSTRGGVSKSEFREEDDQCEKKEEREKMMTLA